MTLLQLDVTEELSVERKENTSKPPESKLPESYRSSRPYPGKFHRLRDAAALEQLITVRCGLCRRAATYLASDLVSLLDPSRDATAPPFVCSKCGKDEYLRVTLKLPDPGD